MLSPRTWAWATTNKARWVVCSRAVRSSKWDSWTRRAKARGRPLPRRSRALLKVRPSSMTCRPPGRQTGCCATSGLRSTPSSAAVARMRPSWLRSGRWTPTSERTVRSGRPRRDLRYQRRRRRRSQALRLVCRLRVPRRSRLSVLRRNRLPVLRQGHLPVLRHRVVHFERSLIGARPGHSPGPDQPKGGVPVEMGTVLVRDPSMTARLPNGAMSEIRMSLAP